MQSLIQQIYFCLIIKYRKHIPKINVNFWKENHFYFLYFIIKFSDI